MFLSVCSFSVMDLIVKWSADYPLGEVLFFRGFFGLIPIFFLIPKNRGLLSSFLVNIYKIVRNVRFILAFFGEVLLGN